MLKKIAKILRDTENLIGIKKAESLEIAAPRTSTLSLRNMNLKPTDIVFITDVLEQEKEDPFIQSISFSYNNLIGDIGATALARSLPLSIHEIGLVDCGIGDKGGAEILNAIKSLPNLKMICMEQNNFSDKLKIEFQVFKKNNPKIMVVI